MAKETFGYTAPQCFYWELRDGGGKRISNNKTNYVMNQYNDNDGYGKYWDHPKKKVYNDRYGSWDWEYIYVNGDHPTVSGSGAKLTGTGKADEIYNYGANANINVGAGDDSIYNDGANANINAGSDNDFINNWGKGSTIDAGAGNDYVDNHEVSNVKINLGTGKDYVVNLGDNVTIDATGDNKGDEILSSAGKKIKIFAGGGNDTITNLNGSNVTILAGAGNDTITNEGSKVTIDAGTGKDTIENSGSNVSINATADGKADSISNDGGDNVTILAGAGNNYIYNNGSKVIIDAGTGNDTIINADSSVSINPGDGDNLVSIYGGEYITLKTGKNIDSVIVGRGYDYSTSVSIQSGAGKNLISLVGGKCSVSISGGENELYFNSSENVVFTGDKNDSITVYGDDGANTLNTSAGNDTVLIKESERGWWEPLVVDTGYQNDSIRNEVNNVSIETGYGKDTVENWGQNVSIQSGDPYTTAGKNLVKNHADNVTIQGGGESDTIKNYKTDNVSINGGRGNDVIRLYSLDSMKNIITTALTPLFKAGVDLNLETINGIIDTCNNVATSIVDVEKLSYVEPNYRGKNQSKIRKKLKEISKETGSINNNLKKLEYALDMAGFDAGRINRLRSGIGKVKKVVDKWLALFDVNDIVSGMVKDYADSEILSTMAKEISSNFKKDENGNLTFAWEKSSGTSATIQGGKGNDKIYGNELASYVYEYKAGDGKDTIFNWNANDTLKITGGSYTGKIVKNDYVVYVGKGSVTFKNYTSRRKRQGYEDLPCQIEGKQANGNYHTASDTYNRPPTPPPEGISVEDNNLTVEENFSGEINLAQNYAEYVTEVNASSAKGNVEIIGSDNVSTIRAGKGNDRVGSTRSFTVIYSGAGKDIVSSSGDSNSIDSGAGNDIIVNVGDKNSIDAGTGNDTIISDGKKNIFAVKDGGNKFIYGFNVKDTLQITSDSGTYSKKTKGNDIIITADGNQITLAGAKALKKINIKATKTKGRNLDNDYENELMIGTSKADTIRNRGNKTTIDAGAGNDSIDNWGGNNVSINAGAGNDSIQNGGHNVTINGGKGNDYVTGWGINTAYVYSAGNDTLRDFDDLYTIVLGSVKINSSVRADDTVTLNLSNKKTLTLTNHWSDKINTVKSIKDVKKINVISNNDDSVAVKGTSQNDYIENWRDKVTITAGNGDDTIENGGANVSINAGDGNDSIRNYNNATITGGKGNDSLWGNDSADKFIYKYGDGDDFIFGFDSADTLTLDGLDFKTSYKNGDVTFKVNGGSVTLREFNTDIFHVNNAVYKISGSKLVKK